MDIRPFAFVQHQQQTGGNVSSRLFSLQQNLIRLNHYAAANATALVTDLQRAGTSLLTFNGKKPVLIKQKIQVIIITLVDLKFYIQAITPRQQM